jgi:hypothetical protein
VEDRITASRLQALATDRAFHYTPVLRQCLGVAGVAEKRCWVSATTASYVRCVLVAERGWVSCNPTSLCPEDAFNFQEIENGRAASHETVPTQGSAASQALKYVCLEATVNCSLSFREIDQSPWTRSEQRRVRRATDSPRPLLQEPGRGRFTCLTLHSRPTTTHRRML